MAKKLKDWTLGEVQEECMKHGNCGVECKLRTGKIGVCKLTYTTPENWSLTDQITLTPDELAVCRLLKAGGADRVERFNKSGWLSIYFGQTEVASGRYICLFPSLRPGDTLDLTTMELE